MTQIEFPGYRMEDRAKRATALLREHEPPEGYYLAFSGGKDSVTVEKLLKMAGVRYEKRYNNTTIDAPELVRFIKRAHPDTIWNQPKHGNMFHRIATAPKVPPTRRGRWCCEEYKEHGGDGRVKIFGVRAQESATRADKWREVAEDLNGDNAICPIVYWTTDHVWEFIHYYNVPYCELYDEGFERLGCVGCPLNPGKQAREFERWPKYRDRWYWAVTENWRRRHNGFNHRTGEPLYQAKFKTADDFWLWWLTAKSPDVMRECQSGRLWTNEEEDDAA